MKILERFEAKPERIIILACVLLAATMIALSFMMMDEMDQIARMKRVIVYVNEGERPSPHRERAEAETSAPTLEPLDLAEG
jgi:hypothetical protein